MATNTHAQHVYNYVLNPPQLDLGLPDQKEKQVLAGAGIQRVECTHVTVKGKSEKLEEVDLYDITSKGLIWQHTILNRKGNLIGKAIYTFNENDYATSRINIDRKGDTTSRRFQLYDEDGRELGYEIYNHKNRLSWKRELAYTDTLLTNAKSYRKGKLSREWKYEYHPNGERSQTKLFNRKGKLLGVWNYACHEEGVEVEKHKDTSTVCIKKTVDPLGNRTEVHLSTRPNGKIRETIIVYNPANKLVSQKVSNGIDRKLGSVWKYTYASDTIVIGEQYTRYKKGRLFTDYITQHNLDGEITSSSYQMYRWGKKKYSQNREFLYDDDGLLISRKLLRVDKKKSMGYVQRVNYVKTKS